MTLPAPSPKPAVVPWFVAAGICFALPFVLLVVGLSTASLAMVYASIGLSVLALPVFVVALVQLVRANR